MKIKQVQELIGNVAQKELNIPIMLIGSTGIGKSYLVKDLAKQLNIDIVDLRLATQEVTDLIGIPRSKNGRTHWEKPDWFPEEGSKGILALEEINRSPEDVRQAIFQLLTEWKLHTHELPKSWIIVALINPDNGEYFVNSLGSAFKRRFCQIVVDSPDVLDWSIWAKENEIDEDVRRFVGQFPEMLGKEEQVTLEAKPHPSNYEMLSVLRKANVIPHNCLNEIANGILGVEAGTVFVQSLQRGFVRPVTAEEVLGDYFEVKERITNQVKENKNGMLYSTSVDLTATLQHNSNINKKGLENLAEFFLDIPAENLYHIILEVPEKITTRMEALSKKTGKKFYNKILSKIKTFQKEGFEDEDDERTEEEKNE